MRIHFGEFVFDGEAREVRHADRAVHLTPKAFELLQLLVAERPRALRKDELRERLWPDVVVEEANLKNLVGEIRGALGPEAIRTVHRFGYAFGATGEVTTVRLVANHRTYALRPGENVIGREPGCAVPLDFTGVSRRHAKLQVTGENAVLEDLGSKNGTWKNEVRVSEPVELHDGDRIRIGAVSITFRSTPNADGTTTLQ